MWREELYKRILVRELDERLGLEAIIAEHLSDSRHGLNPQFRLPDLLRQSICSRLASYEDLNDAARLSSDPTFRLIGSPTRWDRSAALASTLHWFETELLTREENLVGLMAVNREVIGQAETVDRSDRVVLDMGSSESPVHGQQEGSAYNGHFETGCYHPQFLFNDHGDCPSAKLRPGNVSSADDWDELLVPEIERQQAEGQRVAFRADAAFARPEIYEALETRDVQYAIRIPANKNLELAIEDVLFRAPGGPSRKPLVRYKSFHYRADSWTMARRVVAKVEHHVGELFPRVGFIVANLALPSCAVVRFYNKRGTAEQWIKEGKQAAHWTRLSCHRFRANEVRLQLSVLAYNLGNLWRRLVLPTRIDTWSVTSLQQRLVKTRGRLVRHARYYWLLLAESHLTRRLFGRCSSGSGRCRYRPADGRWRPETTGRRTGATREGCPQDVGGGAPACHDSGRMAGVTTRDPRDKKVSHERGLAGVECDRSKMAKSEMSGLEVGRSGFQRRRNMMRRLVLALTMSLLAGGALVAQQAEPAPTRTPAAKASKISTAAQIKQALSAGPTDITKNAAVVEPGEGGQMKQLRAGTNGWVCMPGRGPMCIDKQWQNWVDAWMNKKDPQITAVGIAYMLRGDQGASNTDPFATGPTPDNQWVVSPPHVMVLTPDTKQLDALPTDPHNSGPWVMWKGTKYAHIMVPTTMMPKTATTAKH